MQNSYHLKFDYTDPRTNDLKPVDIKVCDYIVTTAELATTNYDNESDCFHEPVMFEKVGVGNLTIKRIV